MLSQCEIAWNLRFRGDTQRGQKNTGWKVMSVRFFFSNLFNSVSQLVCNDIRDKRRLLDHCRSECNSAHETLFFFFSQELCWAVQIRYESQRCLYNRPWWFWCLWCLLWPDNKWWGVDCISKKTWWLCRFQPDLEWIQIWLWQLPQRRVLARIWQDPSPDKKWNKK